MFTNRRSIKPLLLAGIAGAAYYAYTRLSDEQKRNLSDSVMKYGKELISGIFAASKTEPASTTTPPPEM